MLCNKQSSQQTYNLFIYNYSTITYSILKRYLIYFLLFGNLTPGHICLKLGSEMISCLCAAVFTCEINFSHHFILGSVVAYFLRICKSTSLLLTCKCAMNSNTTLPYTHSDWCCSRVKFNLI